MDDPNYNYETVNRASRACGPLVKWAIAQVIPGPQKILQLKTLLTVGATVKPVKKKFDCYREMI